MSLKALMKRAGPSDRDREEWLEYRAQGITATEIAKIAKNGASARQDLLDAKRSRVFVELTGIRAVDWGRDREPHLEAYAAGFGIQAEHRVFHHAENPRHLASPDGLGVDFDGEIVGFEGKTSKHGIEYAVEAGYLDQIQWCMHVTGADRWLLVWEQHSDFDPLPIVHEWVERDDDRIAELTRIADEFLAELDAPRVRDLVAIRRARARYWAARERRDKYSAQMDEAADELRDLIGEGAVDLGAYRVSVSPVRPGTRFDSTAFKKADPTTYAQFLKPTAPGKPRVTVTKKETE